MITPRSCETLSHSVYLSCIIHLKYRANPQSPLQSDVKRASLFSSMYAVPMIKQMSGQSCQLRYSLQRGKERKKEREENRAQIGRSPDSFAYQDVVGLCKFPSWCEGRVKSHIRVQTTRRLFISTTAGKLKGFLLDLHTHLRAMYASSMNER